MNITIETNCYDEIDFVTVTANGQAAGQNMLDKLLPRERKPQPAPMASMNLPEAAAFINDLSNDHECDVAKRDFLRKVATLLNNLAAAKKIPSIQSVREVTGLGIKGAKYNVEKLPAFPPR